TEADPSSMMVENSHLISKMPERETGLPNTYLFEDVHSSGLLTRPASATKGLPVLDRRRVPFLPWNLSEEKKKKLVKAGLPHGDDTSEIDRALHPVTRIHKVDGA
ncbi:MAG: hypothetical protein ACXWN0_16110, partial [Isosphaeraceae bacterium]